MKAEIVNSRVSREFLAMGMGIISRFRTRALLRRLALLLVPATAAQADVTLPAIFSDHAVLQKGLVVPVWGKAAPGEEIAVALGHVQARTQAASDGKWRVLLDLSKSGPGPFEMTVSGKNALTLHDVVVGEVWLASGQSNMEFTLSNSAGAKEEIAASTDPGLRQFLVSKATSATPLDECGGKWTVAGPATSGGFTAVGYYFGKSLRKTLDVPVGLIHASWGGSPIEAWTSLDALESTEAGAGLRAAADRINAELAAYAPKIEAYRAAYRDWAQKNQRVDTPVNPAPFLAPGAAAPDWKPVTLPGKLADAGLPDAGAVWLRRAVVLPPALMGTGIGISLGLPQGYETVYWNGHKLGGYTPETFPGLGARHSVWLPAELTKVEKNILAVRLFEPVGGLAITATSHGAYIFQISGIPLTGEWLGREERALPPLDSMTASTLPQPPKTVTINQDAPAQIYNGTIAPLLPYAIRGTIWYQGEANADRAVQYRVAFPLMIADWRKRWGRDFPFYYCQLANFQAKVAQPGDSNWAELRDAQTSALSLPDTGEAVLIDIGEETDPHFKDKKDAGERLARIALAKTYGQNVVSSGPVYDTMTIEGSSIRLAFRELGGGLIAQSLPATYRRSANSPDDVPLVLPNPGSPLQGFAICGADRKWAWADARIDGNTVVVSSLNVPQPVAVRYAWANNPTCNLYNQAGLPAVPFRTDDFPLVTRAASY